jgi:hypothetical protein
MNLHGAIEVAEGNEAVRGLTDTVQGQKVPQVFLMSETHHASLAECRGARHLQGYGGGAA